MIADNIYERLKNDATLTGSLSGGQYTGILKGGVWDRPIKREGPAATTEAFYQSINGANLRPCAVVLDGGQTPHFQEESIPHAYNSMPLITLFATASRSGKTALDSAASRIYVLLHNWSFVTNEGPVAFVRFADRTGVRDSEEFIGGISCAIRYQVTSRYQSGE